MNYNLLVKIISAYQILGGISGQIFMFIELSKNPGILIGFWGILYLIAFGLYGLSIVAGYKLLQSFEEGIRLSRITQAVQIVVFATLGYGFSFVSGFKILLGVDTTSEINFFVKYSFSDWRLMINSENESNYVGLNLVAITLLFVLEKINRSYDDSRID